MGMQEAEAFTMFSCNVLPVGSPTNDIPDLGAYLHIQDPISATAGEKGVSAVSLGPRQPSAICPELWRPLVASPGSLFSPSDVRCQHSFLELGV